MKIGFVGNTNNYPFRLARALRELGHELVFFVDRPRSEPRHRPEFHYADIPYPYPEWIREIEPLRPQWLLLQKIVLRHVIRALQTCDGIVLNGLAVSLGTSLHRPIISLLTGSDLDIFANLRQVGALAAASHRTEKFTGSRLTKSPTVFGKRMLFARFIRLQRAGIAKCCLVDYAVPRLLPISDKLLDEIGVDRKRRASFMLTDIEALPSPTVVTNEAFRIFCATRLQWKTVGSGFNASPLDNKGTDVMLEGLHSFVTGLKRPVQIRLIAVGPDVEAAKSLVQDMGLASLVQWLPQLSQKEFLAEMAAADVVMENFGPDGCIGMAGRDAIAMGKPLVAWTKSHAFRQALGEPLPIYEARTPDEICDQLKHIADNPEEVARNSARARDFASRWFSTRRAAERCVAAFEEAQGNGPAG